MIIDSFFSWEGEVIYPRFQIVEVNWINGVNHCYFKNKKALWWMIKGMAEAGQMLEPQPYSHDWPLLKSIAEYNYNNTNV